MSSYQLIGDRDDFQIRKILITAKFANITLNRIDYDIADSKTKELVGNGSKLPALILNPTTALTQANAILRFIARKNSATTLYGETPEQSAQVDQWIDYVLNEVETCAAVLTYPLLGVPGFNASTEATTQAKKDMFTALKKFDAHLLDHMYLVFDKISVADVAAATACINLYKLILTQKDRDSLKNVTRWFYTCVNQPQFKDIIGAVSENAVGSTGGETKTSAVTVTNTSLRGPASTSPAVVNVEYNTTLANGGLWRRNRTRLREIICRPDKGVGLVGQNIEVAGWVKSLQKNMRFLQLGDGSCANTLQIVMGEELVEGADAIKNCGGTDACIRVVGTLVEGKRKENPVEIQAIKITVHGKNLDNAKYPIAKGRQGKEKEKPKKKTKKKKKKKKNIFKTFSKHFYPVYQQQTTTTTFFLVFQVFNLKRCDNTCIYEYVLQSCPVSCVFVTPVPMPRIVFFSNVVSVTCTPPLLLPVIAKVRVKCFKSPHCWTMKMEKNGKN